MAGGLLALLDDVALIARTAASNVDDVAALAVKTSAHSTGVVIDDAAVTPQYVQGVTPARELPMIWRITKGSLFNKLIIILPIALILSQFAPWALTPILMCGGAYLCFEGAEKVLHAVLPHSDHGADRDEEASGAASSEETESKLVSAAITTDLILSAEIMVISLNAVMEETFWMRLAVLIAVGIFMTLGVYGAVALLVKVDDLGLKMIERAGGHSTVGNALVKGMPFILKAISIIGTAAMLWVGGHIVIKGLHDFGSAQPYEFVHHLTESVHNAAAQWLIDTGCSMVFGFALGLVIVGIISAVKASRGSRSAH